MAKLFFKYGAMNSGKTTILLQTAFNYEERGMKVLILKPNIDSKGENYIISRIGLKREVDNLIIPGENVYEYIKGHDDHIKCILIDEAQFLERKQVDELMQVVVRLNIPVICYGLRTDFKNNGFPGSTRLLEIAHTIEEMKTICACGRKAMYNGRKVNGKFVFDGDQVAIDGKDKVTYESLCPNCYYDKYAKYLKLKSQIKK